MLPGKAPRACRDARRPRLRAAVRVGVELLKAGNALPKGAGRTVLGLDGCIHHPGQRDFTVHWELVAPQKSFFLNNGGKLALA